MFSLLGMPTRPPHFPTVEGMYAHLRVSPSDYRPGARLQAMRFEEFTERSRDRMPPHTRGYYQAALINVAGARKQTFGADDAVAGEPDRWRLFFVAPTHAYAWHRAPAACGPILKFYADALPSLPGPIEECFPFFDLRRPNAVDLVPERGRRLERSFVHVARVVREAAGNTQATRVGGHALAGLLYECIAAFDDVGASLLRTGTAAEVLMARFDREVRRRFAEERSVTRYAARLGVSAGHLRDVVRETSGLSPSRYIGGVIVGEARRMLTARSLTASEVAYALGFSSPSHFGRYFKRYAGQPPGTLRTAARESTTAPQRT